MREKTGISFQIWPQIFGLHLFSSTKLTLRHLIISCFFLDFLLIWLGLELGLRLWVRVGVRFGLVTLPVNTSSIFRTSDPNFRMEVVFHFYSFQY
jgi:hypothetical protein